MQLGREKPIKDMQTFIICLHWSVSEETLAEYDTERVLSQAAKYAVKVDTSRPNGVLQW